MLLVRLVVHKCNSATHLAFRMPVELLWGDRSLKGPLDMHSCQRPASLSLNMGDLEASLGEIGNKKVLRHVRHQGTGLYLVIHSAVY